MSIILLITPPQTPAEKLTTKDRLRRRCESNFFYLFLVRLVVLGFLSFTRSQHC